MKFIDWYKARFGKDEIDPDMVVDDDGNAVEDDDAPLSKEDIAKMVADGIAAAMNGGEGDGGEGDGDDDGPVTKADIEKMIADGVAEAQGRTAASPQGGDKPPAGTPQGGKAATKPAGTRTNRVNIAGMTLEERAKYGQETMEVADKAGKPTI